MNSTITQAVSEQHASKSYNWARNGTHKSISKKWREHDWLLLPSDSTLKKKHIIIKSKSINSGRLTFKMQPTTTDLKQIYRLYTNSDQNQLVARISQTHWSIMKSKRTLSDNTYGNVRLMRNRIANLWGTEKRKKRRCRERFSKDAKLMISLSLSLSFLRFRFNRILRPSASLYLLTYLVNIGLKIKSNKPN